MRISDWSSDVCSSDLAFGLAVRDVGKIAQRRGLLLLAERMDDAVAQEDLLRLGIEQMRGHQFDLVDQQVRRTNARATAGHGLTAAGGAGTITAARAGVLVNADVFARHAETFGERKGVV